MGPEKSPTGRYTALFRSGNGCISAVDAGPIYSVETVKDSLFNLAERTLTSTVLRNVVSGRHVEVGSRSLVGGMGGDDSFRLLLKLVEKFRVVRLLARRIGGKKI